MIRGEKGNAQIKTSNMNDNTCDYATGQPISLINEAIPDASVFFRDAPDPTSGAAASSTIVPDARIPPSRQKQLTKTFFSANMSNISKKGTIGTTPAPDAATAAHAKTSARSTDLTVSNSPYSFRNQHFPTSSISTKKPNKRQKVK